MRLIVIHAESTAAHMRLQRSKSTAANANSIIDFSLLTPKFRPTVELTHILRLPKNFFSVFSLLNRFLRPNRVCAVFLRSRASPTFLPNFNFSFRSVHTTTRRISWLSNFTSTHTLPFSAFFIIKDSRKLRLVLSRLPDSLQCPSHNLNGLQYILHAHTRSSMARNESTAHDGQIGGEKMLNARNHVWAASAGTAEQSENKNERNVTERLLYCWAGIHSIDDAASDARSKA